MGKRMEDVELLFIRVGLPGDFMFAVIGKRICMPLLTWYLQVSFV